MTANSSPIMIGCRPWVASRPTAAADLTGALGPLPRLDGAVCRGRGDLWDADDPDDPKAQQAIAACMGCPALAACAGWLASLPPHRWPRGVVAGAVVHPEQPPVCRPPPKPKQRPPRKLKIARCTEWLADRLDGHGSVPLRDINDEGAALGFFRKELHVAADRLGVVRTGSVHAALGGDGRPHWRLPGPRETPPQTSTDAMEPSFAVDRRDGRTHFAQNMNEGAATDETKETA